MSPTGGRLDRSGPTKSPQSVPCDRRAPSHRSLANPAALPFRASILDAERSDGPLRTDLAGDATSIRQDRRLPAILVIWPGTRHLDIKPLVGTESRDTALESSLPSKRGVTRVGSYGTNRLKPK
jgi:hypothetical protein